MSLADEIARIFNEELLTSFAAEDPDDMQERISEARRLASHASRDTRKANLIAYLNGLVTNEQENLLVWFKALVFSSVDLSLNLMGKHPNYELLAITTVRTNTAGVQKPVELPGGKLAAFLGFMSWYMGDYETQFADYCAVELLKKSNLIPIGTSSDDPGTYEEYLEKMFDGSNRKEYKAEITKGLTLFGERIEEVLLTSEILNSVKLSGTLKFVLGKLAGKIKDAMLEANDAKEVKTTY